MKLTLDQKRVLSEFIANIGVTWFAGGIVAPAFTAKNLSEIIIPGLWGLVLSIISISFSILIVRKK
jgi:hypothetical protein